MTTSEARDLALTSILADHDLTNEAGLPVVDFINQNRDALDFMNVSRRQLYALMAAAYEAGRREGQEAELRHHIATA